MKESSKINNLWELELVDKFLQGRMIDIGAGNDLIFAWAEGFDLSQGDANYITKYRAISAYEAVCSSHCLEHMFNPEDALLEWWALVKPGGYLLLTVPDEDLYEQGFFPSRFNFDHKLTFRFRKPHSWCQKSYDVESLVSFLPGVQIVSVELQSDNYDHSLQFKYGDRASESRLLPYLYLKLERRLGYYNQIVNRFRRQLFQRCVPIDQTHGDVLAQIQLVAQSRLPVSPRFENE